MIYADWAVANNGTIAFGVGEFAPFYWLNASLFDAVREVTGFYADYRILSAQTHAGIQLVSAWLDLEPRGQVSSMSHENCSRSKARATAPLKRWSGRRAPLTILWPSRRDQISLTA